MFAKRCPCCVTRRGALSTITCRGRLGGLKSRANELPDTVKIGILLGAYTDKYYQGYYYFKAQNLRRRLRASYDAALSEFDLLMMPTTRKDGFKRFRRLTHRWEALMQHSWEQINQHRCPFNVTHHPAPSQSPCGFGEGERPIGLMLIAKHWQESTIYRAADAFERASDWQKMGPTGKR